MNWKPADIAMVKALAGKGGSSGGGSVIVPNIQMTATGLPAGSEPTVQRSGSNTNPVFNLGIPAGAAGTPGKNGFSPTVSVVDIPDGHRVTITDAAGPHSFDVMNGTDGTGGEGSGEPGKPGEDGFSPTVTVTNIEGGHRVSITDIDGTKTFDVLNGTNGKDGEPGAPGEPGTPGKDGTPGENGATFTPSVSETGILSWTNDGGLPNPDPVDIKGPKGDGADLTPGRGVTIKDNTISVTVPVADLTQEEYDALPDEQKKNGLYFLPDDSPDSGGSGSSMEVYDDEERVIGTWFGKPLYRKVIEGVAPSSSSVVNDVANFGAVDRFVHLYGFILTRYGSEPIPTYYGNRRIGFGVQGGYVRCSANGEIYYDKPVYVIGEYTKTTDEVTA